MVPRSFVIVPGAKTNFDSGPEGGFVITWRRMLKVQSWLGLVLFCLCAVSMWGAGGTAPTIAVAVTTGQVDVNHIKADGGANVPEGAVLRTAEAAARLQFRNGARATLGADSQATVFAGRLVLQAGSGLVNGSTPITLEALGFRVQPQSTTGSALVEHKGRYIQVSAVAGPVAVYDMQGALLARVETGKPLTFEPSGLVRMAPDDPSNKDPKKDKGAAKTGLSHGARVGIGVAVTAGVGLGVALPMAVLSR
jgi:hypothetical protein